ncbi:MAG TPA: F0F1 ATP synthase subunit A [Terriglobales bacterium]|nr:F0F1 ATP synthase subunit A [Terriglobales bacterium]
MEQLAFTQFLNHLFGGPVLALLQMLHIQPDYPAHPISNSFAMEVLVFLLLTLFFLAARTRLSVDSPGALQHVVEGIEGFIGDMAAETIGGHHYQRYVPYLVTLGLFILVGNLLGLVPGLESPTGVPIVPLGCALVTWFYYHYQGVRENGAVGYLKHFLGPVWWLAPLMFFIEVCSHLARILSLTIRLFANMFAGEMVTLVFFSLIPLFVPIIFQGLHIGVAVIQTYIFVLLACVYLGEATAHEH